MKNAWLNKGYIENNMGIILWYGVNYKVVSLKGEKLSKKRSTPLHHIYFYSFLVWMSKKKSIDRYVQWWYNTISGFKVALLVRSYIFVFLSFTRWLQNSIIYWKREWRLELDCALRWTPLTIIVLLFLTFTNINLHMQACI